MATAPVGEPETSLNAREPKSITVVVPVFNEQLSLRRLYDELVAALALETWEVVFVDDGSDDGSHEELVALHDEHTNVRVVTLRRNFGKSAALAAGFDEVRGELVATIDSDLQDDPAEIPSLLAKLDEGFDLVSGWKANRKDSLPRRGYSRVYNGVTRMLTGVKLHDMNCGLKLYRAEVVRDIQLYGDLHRYIPVLAEQQGFRLAEVPVNHRPREHGKSKFGRERYARGFFDLLTVVFIGRYRHRPLHLFGGVGLVLGLIGFGILTYLTIVKIGGEAIGGRPLLLLGALLLIVGIQFVSLGLLGEMITSGNAERAGSREQRVYVRDVLD